MPSFDMPLAKLLTYQGCNPRPEDFDAYWDRAIAEMKSISPQLELFPSEFQIPYADCFDLYFTGVKGARIYAKYIRPKRIAEPHPAIVQFHGYSASSGEWIDKVPYASLGYSVFAMDCRGQGGRSEDVGGTKGTTLRGHIIRGIDDHPDQLLFRDVFLDAAQLAGIAMDMPEVDASRVGAIGGSQGGALSMVCAALEPRIKRLAPVYPFLSDYKRVWDMDLAKDSYQEIKDYFRRHDPQHKREEEFFTKLGYIDIQHLAGRIQGEVMMGISQSDTICPPSTQFAAFNKIKSKKSYELYPDFGHEGLPGFYDKTFTFMLGL
ncbi:acetylxylan esterase [Paenibacillus roseipurpureus]|uniref:Alpha/beta fold hydrolase n=1 Tax=Paenibacillus roseopurpureus TaxID=2918901 RepID=A0AA96LU49_9BACL|nr:alpha/beta fold hydrolase [Paenibacillus sp. MBLB1832]WNR46108.1 alpha/beta fold hydrolase [Paenibacillus sp. MBLB1832]